MNATTFDTHQAVRRLEAAGIETRQAEAIVSEMRDAVGVDLTDFATKADLADFATKSDLALLRTELDAKFSGLEARMYRALWIQGGAIVAILAALRFLPA